MLIVSFLSSGLSGMTSLPPRLADPFTSSANGVVALKGEVSIRPWELSTRMTLRSDGMDSDRKLDERS
jgi:hypothetical protein